MAYPSKIINYTFNIHSVRLGEFTFAKRSQFYEVL
jgi:hypothetical protein